MVLVCIFWDSYMLLIIWSNSCTWNNCCYLWNRTKVLLPTIRAFLLVQVLALKTLVTDTIAFNMHSGLLVQILTLVNQYLHHDIQRFLYAVKPIIIIYILYIIPKIRSEQTINFHFRLWRVYRNAYELWLYRLRPRIIIMYTLISTFKQGW